MWIRVLPLLLLVTGASVVVEAADAPVINAERLATPPRIDGVLDDRAWTAAPVNTDDWRSYNLDEILKLNNE